MKIANILANIDNGSIALPEFQRGYVWNRKQVRALFESLYRRHPVGGLLVWTTDATGAQSRGDGKLAAGAVKLLLDGQQRVTSLYGVMRGRPPKFFQGNSLAFENLMFHLGTETFQFYQPVKMKGDPLWIDVTAVMRGGVAGLGALMASWAQDEEMAPRIPEFMPRLTHLLAIDQIDLHEDEVTGADMTVDIVVEIFNRVNSGGTKLSKGDLALAKICADWPEARTAMRAALAKLKRAGFDFTLDWLLRSVNTVLTGEAKFVFLHDRTTEEIQDGLQRATKHIHTCLNLIGSRLGLDHDRVLFGRFAIPVMVRYLDRHAGGLSAKELDKLLFWFVQAGMWGRFSGSTETAIDADIAALSDSRPLDRLLDQLKLWRGGLRVEPGHFDGWSRGARFYPLLYLLTRMGGARDWCTGIRLKAHLLGGPFSLELHHIFPKAQLYKRGHPRQEVNALANFCFLTKSCNLKIGAQLPEAYFPRVERNHPGALASQWIPSDPELWKIKNYGAFLDERRKLLAAEANRRLSGLLHGERHWLGTAPSPAEDALVSIDIAGPREEEALEAVNLWMRDRGLPAGALSYEHADGESGQHLAVLDLAWPDGIQEGLSEPVAILLNEPSEVLAAANQGGYRCFTAVGDFQTYVAREILAEPGLHRNG